MLLFVGIHSLRNQAEDGDGAHEEDCVIKLSDQISGTPCKDIEVLVNCIGKEE